MVVLMLYSSNTEYNVICYKIYKNDKYIYIYIYIYIFIYIYIYMYVYIYIYILSIVS